MVIDPPNWNAVPLAGGAANWKAPPTGGAMGAPNWNPENPL